ncbi:helix-turn-helix transcriptional regulator [Heliobacterium chlorum]|uniref:Helix-turn-helix transcriptional regulator n=1 Tax=Heliobacterium chlorum TaxID=2698 RepID=A0ABR7T5P4_HELCL|nr:helix-turn-helix transcriptional regulator [Heliobacterium chlorum]MBC9785333.1 helix-turn-helix transcriptional regulator [Heliobacterium chlorum]
MEGFLLIPNICPASLSNILFGKMRPGDETIKKMAAMLNVPENEIRKAWYHAKK